MKSKVRHRSDSLVGWCKHWELWFVLALILTLILRGAAILSWGWGNAGMVMLEQALFATPGRRAQDIAARAEMLLRQAMVYAPGSRSTWRGLGFALAIQGREDEAVTAWQSAGGMGEKFIQWGEEARSEGQYEEALKWYDWSLRVDSGLGDPWYYRGLVYEVMGRWEEALEAYKRAIEAGVFVHIGRSSPYYRMGRIYQWWLEPRQVDAALRAYEAAIEASDFGANWEAADCHYKRGEIYSWQGRDPRESIRDYQQAISLNPNHHWAHLRLGYALYQVYGDVALAERVIGQAIDLWPDDRDRKWPYRFLGDIYRESGMIDKAIVAYQDVLRFDPNDAHAQNILRMLREE